MVFVVTTPVTEIDAADERHVVHVALGVEQQHQLLMVRTAAPDTRVEQHGSARFVHDAGEIARLLLVEAEHPRMRAPKQPSDLDAAGRETGEHVTERRASGPRRSSSSPRQSVKRTWSPASSPGRRSHQPREVRSPVDQGFDTVAHGPRDSGLLASPNRRRRVPPLLRRKEPIGCAMHPVSLRAMTSLGEGPAWSESFGPTRPSLEGRT